MISCSQYIDSKKRVKEDFLTMVKILSWHFGHLLQVVCLRKACKGGGGHGHPRIHLGYAYDLLPISLSTLLVSSKTACPARQWYYSYKVVSRNRRACKMNEENTSSSSILNMFLKVVIPILLKLKLIKIQCKSLFCSVLLRFAPVQVLRKKAPCAKAGRQFFFFTV